MEPTVNETECTFEVAGAKFTNMGAFVNEEFAQVYVRSDGPPTSGKVVRVSTWNGAHLGFGVVKSTWEKYSKILGSCRWCSVRFTINNVTYAGRLNWDNGELVRGKRVKS